MSAEDWQQTLRGSGYRLTPQRELILRAVDKLGHATPDEVLAEVRTSSAAVNVSTVYRTLEVLEEIGLVRHAHMSDRAPTYHSVSDHEHFHLVCRGCHRVISVEAEGFGGLAAELRERHGFNADVGHLTVFGSCADCTDPAHPVPARQGGTGADPAQDVPARQGGVGRVGPAELRDGGQ